MTFEFYKSRWGIEIFYNYLKNQAGYNSLLLDNYNKPHGLDFIILVSAFIFSKMEESVKDIKGKSLRTAYLLMSKLFNGDSVTLNEGEKPA